MKTYLKTLSRMFTRHVTRFVSIILMVLITVGFVSGLGTATDKIGYSLSDYYRAQNVSDFIIKCTGDGFTEDDIEAVKSLFKDEKLPVTVNTGMSVDFERSYQGKDGAQSTEIVRVYFLDGFSESDWTVNVPEIKDKADSGDGTNENTAYTEVADNKLRGFEVGEEIELDFVEILSSLARQSGEELDENYKKTLETFFDPVSLTVGGSVLSPLTFGLDGEPSYIQDDDADSVDIGTLQDLENLNCLGNIIYTSTDVIPRFPDYIPVTGGTRLLGTGDIYVAIGDRTLFNSFNKNYEKYIDEKTEQILGALTDDGGEQYAEVITLYDNVSFSLLHSYAQKVEGLSWVLMVVFLLVTALVGLSNMTRLMEEERSQIACLRTLGYSAFKIIFKYVLFAMIATGIGGVGSYFVGVGLAYLIYYVFNFSYVMPPMSPYFAMVFYLVVFFIIAATILAATIFSGLKMTCETCANLLRPKPPKSGKKVIIEKIPFIWNRLSFKYKSTVRNVLRYMSRFLMTVIAVAFSMSLVMAGLGILDLCLFGDLASMSIVAIAIVVIVFAGLLTATVVYTLTNINISERNRELATLMVLGYHDGEVAGYIYREIYIDTAIGIILGYPLSAFLVWLIFSVIGLGTLGGISWFMWLIAPIAVLAFTALVTLLLRRRIVGIDMNESLKAIE